MGDRETLGGIASHDEERARQAAFGEHRQDVSVMVVMAVVEGQHDRVAGQLRSARQRGRDLRPADDGGGARQVVELRRERVQVHPAGAHAHRRIVGPDVVVHEHRGGGRDEQWLLHHARHQAQPHELVAGPLLEPSDEGGIDHAVGRQRSPHPPSHRPRAPGPPGVGPGAQLGIERQAARRAHEDRAIGQPTDLHRSRSVHAQDRRHPHDDLPDGSPASHAPSGPMRTTCSAGPVTVQPSSSTCLAAARRPRAGRPRPLAVRTMSVSVVGRLERDGRKVGQRVSARRAGDVDVRQQPVRGATAPTPRPMAAPSAPRPGCGPRRRGPAPTAPPGRSRPGRGWRPSCRRRWLPRCACAASA